MSGQQQAEAITNIIHGKHTFTGLKGKWPGSTEPDRQEVKVDFDKVFPAKFPPTIVNLSVVDLDVGGTNDQTTNVRYKVYYKDVSRTGFTLVAETWYSTIINQIGVEWLVIN